MSPGRLGLLQIWALARYTRRGLPGGLLWFHSQSLRLPAHLNQTHSIYEVLSDNFQDADLNLLLTRKMSAFSTKVQTPL